MESAVPDLKSRPQDGSVHPPARLVWMESISSRELTSARRWRPFKTLRRAVSIFLQILPLLLAGLLALYLTRR